MNLHQPANKIPAVTQRMWETACNDLNHAEIMLEMARQQPDATPEIIARWVDQTRIRKAICNGINFLITNRDDVNAVIERKKRQ